MAIVPDVNAARNLDVIIDNYRSDVDDLNAAIPASRLTRIVPVEEQLRQAISRYATPIPNLDSLMQYSPDSMVAVVIDSTRSVYFVNAETMQSAQKKGDDVSLKNEDVKEAYHYKFGGFSRETKTFRDWGESKITLPLHHAKKGQKASESNCYVVNKEKFRYFVDKFPNAFEGTKGSADPNKYFVHMPTGSIRSTGRSIFLNSE